VLPELVGARGHSCSSRLGPPVSSNWRSFVRLATLATHWGKQKESRIEEGEIFNRLFIALSDVKFDRLVSCASGAQLVFPFSLRSKEEQRARPCSPLLLGPFLFPRQSFILFPVSWLAKQTHIWSRIEKAEKVELVGRRQCVPGRAGPPRKRKGGELIADFVAPAQKRCSCSRLETWHEVKLFAFGLDERFGGQAKGERRATKEPPGTVFVEQKHQLLCLQVSARAGD